MTVKLDTGDCPPGEQFRVPKGAALAPQHIRDVQRRNGLLEDDPLDTAPIETRYVADLRTCSSGEKRKATCGVRSGVCDSE